MRLWPKDLVHRKLTGVCAGIANRLGVSRVTVRIVALIALILLPPVTLAAYLLAVLVMPPRYELKRWLD